MNGYFLSFFSKSTINLINAMVNIPKLNISWIVSNADKRLLLSLDFGSTLICTTSLSDWIATVITFLRLYSIIRRTKNLIYIVFLCVSLTSPRYFFPRGVLRNSTSFSFDSNFLIFSCHFIISIFYCYIF